MKGNKSTISSVEVMKQREWGPVRISLIAVAVALGIDFVCFVLSARSDLFSTLFRNF